MKGVYIKVEEYREIIMRNAFSCPKEMKFMSNPFFSQKSVENQVSKCPKIILHGCLTLKSATKKVILTCDTVLELSDPHNFKTVRI